MKKLVLIPIITLFLSGSGLVATVAPYGVNINGERLSATVLNHNGSTYLPARQIAESLGAEVSFTGNAVNISTVDVDKLKESCVMIIAENSTKGSQGSAVCWDYGEYLTAYHIVDDGKTDVRTSGNEDLEIGSTDAKIDIATLKSTDNIKPVKIGDSDDVAVGDKVLLISSPQRAENTVSYFEVEINSTQIVLNGKIESGASGGGVFNMQGELVGILTSSNNSVNDIYVTPINEIREAF